MSAESLGNLRKGGIYQYAEDNPVKISDKDYIIRTTEYALYPNKTLEKKLLHTLEVCRTIYNSLRNILVAIIRRYRRQYGKEWTKRLESRHYRIYDDRALSKIARAIWNKNGDMKDIYQNLLNDVSKRVYNTFNRYFTDTLKGKNPGYPRFKSENSYDSFTYPHMSGYGFCDRNGKKYRPGSKKGFDRIRLGKIGLLKFRNKFRIPGVMKTATVSRTRIGDHYDWKVCIVWRMRPYEEHFMSIENPNGTMGPIGIDLGLKNLVALSDGTRIPNDNTYRKKEKVVSKLQKRMADIRNNDPDHEGSHRYQSLKRRLSHGYKRWRNHRKDLYHKLTSEIVYNHGDIYAENLDILRMMRDSNSKTMKKLYRDAAWSTFMTKVEYKAECAGTSVFRVDPHNTSNLCSGCGHMVRKDLSVRIHECPHCNLKLDRDVNAARNILSRGLGAARPGPT